MLYYHIQLQPTDSKAPTGKEYLVNVYSDEIVKEDIERIKIILILLLYQCTGV